MFTQKKATASQQKLHSIHALPDGKAFTGKIAAGKVNYLFTFVPKAAESASGKLKLKGSVIVRTPAGAKRTADAVEATLLSTQGNIQQGPAIPRNFPESLRPPAPAPSSMPITDATDAISSIGVMYLKLSPLDGRALGVPMDLEAVQLNARLYPQSELERDLQWLYSWWLLTAHRGDEKLAQGFLEEINRRLA
jgi:hypothetical protein